MKKLEDLEKKYKELGEEIERLKKEQSAGKWIPEYGEYFYFVGIDLSVDCSWFDSHNKADKDIIKYTKIFKTEEEAQEYADYLKARYEYTYEFTKEEWEDNSIFKYFIQFNYNNYNDLIINTHFSIKEINGIFFESKEKAQEFIDKYKKQILKFEFGIMEE